MRTRPVADERGQTFTEYLMVLGILTAIIISLTGMIVPGIRDVVRRLVTYMATFLTTP